jgi:hypothetical protein
MDVDGDLRGKHFDQLTVQEGNHCEGFKPKAPKLKFPRSASALGGNR